MRNVELLNAITHAGLGVGPHAGRERWQGFVELVVAELHAAADHYPLFLVKNAETGRFAIGMLHGIRAGEPIPADRQASAPFEPAALRRQGFFAVGPDLGVDPADPRFGVADREPLFEGDGRPAGPLHDAQQAVAALKTGRAETDRFVARLLELRLVEGVAASLDFDDGERLDLEGLYTVSLDRVNALGDADALALFRDGHLRLAFCIAASLGRLAGLARERNRALAL